MKFDCDSREQKRIARAERVAAALRDWHKWFAWYPVRMGDNDCRWLETVYRRATCAEPFKGYPREVFVAGYEYSERRLPKK